MTVPKIIIDTNVVSYLMRDSLAARADATFWVTLSSVIRGIAAFWRRDMIRAQKAK